MSDFDRLGYEVLPISATARAWSDAAYQVALTCAADSTLQAKWLRHQNTWFVGVDVLPNARDGSLGGAPLTGPWERRVTAPEHWHRAQLSITYPGYPGRDAQDSDARARYREVRYAAHVDGLLLEDGRRYLREPHAFVLGLPLNTCDACPLMVWPGSHAVMGPALREALITSLDVTEAYIAARKHVFDTIEPVALRAQPGQSMVLHRHVLHGIAPSTAGDIFPPEGRMIAYFRPQFARLHDWA